MRFFMKSGSFNLLKHSEPTQVCFRESCTFTVVSFVVGVVVVFVVVVIVTGVIIALLFNIAYLCTLLY